MKRDEAIERLLQHEADLKRLGVEHLYLFGSTGNELMHWISANGLRPYRDQVWLLLVLALAWH
jgi:hypothetical protein